MCSAATTAGGSSSSDERGPHASPLRAILNTDGGARGNPGPAGIGIVLRDANGDLIAEKARAIGRATNNVAEYTALIEGLELALENDVTEVKVFLDSALVVAQVKGEWKIKKDALRVLAVRARALMGRFERASIDHVPREQNEDADALANQAMDSVAGMNEQGSEDEQGSLGW